MKRIFFFTVFIFFAVGFLFSTEKPVLKEIPQKRTKFSKTIKTGHDNYKLILFDHPRHFRNASGAWQNINPDFVGYENGYANLSNTIKSVVVSDEIRFGIDEPIILKGLKLTNNEGVNLVFDRIEKIAPNILSLQASDKIKVVSSYGKIRIEIDVSSNCRFEFDLKPNKGWSVEKSQRQILIKNHAGKSVYKFGLPKIVVSSRIIAFSDYKINETENGYLITVHVPNNINTTQNANMILEVTGGYEPDELIINGVQKYYENDNVVGSASASGSNIGRWIIVDSTNTYYAYRAYQYFDISALSSTAEIDSAHYKFTFSNSFQNFTVNLKQMSKHYQSTPGLLWDDCEDGNDYGSFSSNVNGVYSEKYESWDDFCNDIKNNMDDGWFGVGFYTLDSPDEYITIFSGIDTSLIIYYHDPQEYFDFNVDYDFGTGYVTVNDLYGTRNENIPYHNAYQYNNTVTVTAHNQQGGDYFRVFEKWDWTIGDKNQESITDSVLSIEVTDSVSYEGRFNRRFDFNAENDFMDGGDHGELIVDNVSEGAPYFRYFVEHIDEPFTIAAPDQPLSVNNRTVDYFFINWDDGNTSNPRTFSPTDHDLVQAIYKGHLVSDTSLATGHNNGRRMVWDAQNTLYMVYEDGHQIWFTQSLDTGAIWIPEKIINQYYPQSHPSIAVNYNGVEPSVHVVYETLVPKPAGGFDHAITYQHKGSAGWEAPEYLDGYISSQWIGNTGERPVVVSETGDVLYIAWRDVNSGKIKVIYKSPTNGWSPITELSVTNGYPVIGRTATGTRKTKLIWSDGNDIKYTECEYNPTGHYWMTYYAYNMTGMFSYAHDAKPTMAIDANGIAHVAWQVENNAYGSKEILYHEYSVNNGCLLVGSLYSLDQTYLSYEMGDASISYQNGISTPVTIFYDDLGSISRIHWTGTNYGWSIKTMEAENIQTQYRTIPVVPFGPNITAPHTLYRQTTMLLRVVFKNWPHQI